MEKQHRLTKNVQMTFYQIVLAFLASLMTSLRRRCPFFVKIINRHRGFAQVCIHMQTNKYTRPNVDHFAYIYIKDLIFFFSFLFLITIFVMNIGERPQLKKIILSIQKYSLQAKILGNHLSVMLNKSTTRVTNDRLTGVIIPPLYLNNLS